jgi:hypothetical protein
MKGRGTMTLRLRILLRLVFVAGLASSALLTSTAPARGQDAPCWPLASRSRTLLGFGCSYDAGGTGPRTHSGADLAADPGDEVLAPFDAEVTFAGMVPSGSGGTVPALTLTGPQGERLTLMPLERVSVRAGERVAPGETLARLAGSGDPSSVSPHLHVSLRAGSLYVDPLSRLSAEAPPAREPAPTGSPEEPAIEPPPAPAPARVLAPAPEPLAATAPRTSAPRTTQSPTEARGRVPERTSSPVPAAPSATGARAPVASAASPGRTRGTGPVIAPAAGTGASKGLIAAGLPSSRPWLPAVNLADLAGAARARDRALAMVVSYLLATIAASGLIAWAMRGAGPVAGAVELGTVPVRES